MRETSDLIEKSSAGSCPSEANGGGWDGLGKDGQEPALRNIISLIIRHHGDRDASLLFQDFDFPSFL